MNVVRPEVAVGKGLTENVLFNTNARGVVCAPKEIVWFNLAMVMLKFCVAAGAI